MRALMGLIKDRHGTYCAQQKVPERLQAAVARVLGNGKSRQAHLKKSLGTKDLRQANIRAKPVLAGFDRTMAEATALMASGAAEPLLRASLNETEITRMAEHVYATALAWDERFRFGGREEMKRAEAELRAQLEPGEGLPPFIFPYESQPPHGRSMALHAHEVENLTEDLHDLRGSLALGDISAVEHHVADALKAFGIKLAPGSLSYPLLGIAVLRAYVRALQDLEKRNAGEPIETPKLPLAILSAPAAGGTLSEALAGWERHRPRPPRTVQEFTRSIEMFIQLHGNLPVSQIKKSHTREYRETLQDMPRFRKGVQLKATLPELAAWGRTHPEAQKIVAATINKQLSALQAVMVLAADNGLVPEDAGWTDPVSRMRLPEDEAERVPFELADLQTIINAPIFQGLKLPKGARGDAGIWLPLIAMYTGARQSEIAGLSVADVRQDAGTGIPYLLLVEERKVGKRLKTKTSRRAVPIHSQLVAFGFLDFVAARKASGEKAWLFPLVAPGHKGGVQAWSKWWGRYLRLTVGVMDATKVFHSFRHGFKDAARTGSVSLEVHDALMGQTNASTVSEGYGAKLMLQRFGVVLLRDAIEKINYTGLDLSRVRTGFGSLSA